MSRRKCTQKELDEAFRELDNKTFIKHDKPQEL
jgi:hypothetical protein